MTTVIRVMTPLLFDHQAQAVVAVLAALAAGLLLGAGEAAAWPRGGG
jgi:hypothetical protein